jgi:predicted nuclease of predicted toxin-antitoxin system
MVLFADESIEAEVIKVLREQWHTVHSIAEISPSLSDKDVLDFAVKADAVLLTNDKDFGDLVNHQGLSHRGIILLRLRKTSALEKAKVVSDVINLHENILGSAFTVITPTSVRIRKS